MRFSIIICALLLAGCNSSEKTVNSSEKTNQNSAVVIEKMTTTAYTHDRQLALCLHVHTAHRDSHQHLVQAHGVCATLTHRNTHTMTVHTPVAAWEERTRRLTTNGASVLQHQHGTLEIGGGTDLRLDQHHLVCYGPIRHTLSF